MELTTTAIVCTVRQHGEHGVIARLMTEESGLLAGYVRGGRSRTMRPVLIPGNIVSAHFRARTVEQLASLTVELARSRASLMGEPLPAAAIDWMTAFTAAALPEGEPHAVIHSGLDAALAAVELGGVARTWAIAVVRYEALVLSELGYADDLEPTRDLATALRRNRTALRSHLLEDRRGEALLGVRERLADRLGRALG